MTALNAYLLTHESLKDLQMNCSICSEVQLYVKVKAWTGHVVSLYTTLRCLNANMLLLS